jgi:hypothetical protein
LSRGPEGWKQKFVSLKMEKPVETFSEICYNSTDYKDIMGLNAL